MITSRTPLRVSFLGGGTDYPSFFNFEPGYVLGTTINKYVYVNILPLPEFADEKYRFTYRVTESVSDYRDFLHPVVREVLREKRWKQPLNISTLADLPGRSGLGSSSSFTVGFLNALNHYERKTISPYKLARNAIRIEREILNESGGWQDQFHGALGGFRLYKFHAGKVQTVMIPFEPGFVEYVSNSLVLLPVLNWRKSKIYADITERNLLSSQGIRLGVELATLTNETCRKITMVSTYLEQFNYLCSSIRKAWQMKLDLSGHTVEPEVLEKIQKGLDFGASAARLCGAGGNGFVLFLVDPSKRESFVGKLASDFAFSVSIASHGSEIL